MKTLTAVLALGIVLSCSITGHAQMNERIKKQSDNNRSSRSSSGSSHSSGGGVDAEDTMNCCFSLLDLFVTVAATLPEDDGYQVPPPLNLGDYPPPLVEYETEPLPDTEPAEEREQTVMDTQEHVVAEIGAEVISGLEREFAATIVDENVPPPNFELGLSVGPLPSNYIVYMPHARYNGKVYVTDLRVFVSQEQRLDSADTYTTVDWQMAMFNLVKQENVQFRIGTGLLHENYSGLDFNEHCLQLDAHLWDRVWLNSEARLAIDYKTSTTVRAEFNLGLDYGVYQTNKVDILLGANILTAKYYEEVHLWTCSFGIKFRFR